MSDVYCFVFCQLLLVLGCPILLDEFKIEYEVPDVSKVDAKISGCMSYGDLVLYDIHEWWWDIGRINVELICWKCWGRFRKYLGLTLCNIYLRCFGCGSQEIPHYWNLCEVNSVQEVGSWGWSIRYLWAVSVSVHCIYDTLFPSALMVSVV